MVLSNTSYYDLSTELEGFAAYPKEKNRPVVILCHGWKGRDGFICEKAKMVAEWGYVGFALDMYGKGVIGKTKEENGALKKPFMEDRSLLQGRVMKGFETAQSLPNVDASRVAVLGFGFGGICALDLARSGADLKGAISIYGHFDPPPRPLIKPIRAKILIFHGYNDPITSQKELRSIEKEMDEAKADWQLHLYGNTLHAFALPEANDREHGLLYNPTSTSRTWKTTHQFLEEVLE